MKSKLKERKGNEGKMREEKGQKKERKIVRIRAKSQQRTIGKEKIRRKR